MKRPATVASGATGVRSALDRYFQENGFSAASYTADPEWRRRSVPLHDLHHLATGYGTDLVGEGEVSAFELAAGVPFDIVRVVICTTFLVGIFLAPLRMLRAFLRGWRCRSLYDRALPYPRLVELSIAELRAHIGLTGAAAHRPPLLHVHAP